MKMMKMMTKSIFTVALLAMLISLPAFGASVNKSIKVEAGTESDGATSVNGSVSVGDDAVVTGNVRTVNGKVRVDSGAMIESASTVNGSLKIASNVQAKDLSTVNGSVKVGESSTVSGEIEAVNGSIRVDKGTTIGGNVGNVNGKIELTGAEVGGDVSTVNGDVRLDGGSVVKGDLIVEKPSGWSWGKSRKPTIVIGPGSVVVGNIVLEREVELYISESAEVGGVTGVMSIVDAERFSGDRP
jgi:DUF4097 and DUF4098 domain-containing protein YvlB